MNVLFITRHSIESLSGGDKIQILNTQAALERLGITVTISNAVTPQLQGIDLVHVFNPSQISSRTFNTIRTAGIPIVVSTIHWDMRTYYHSMFETNRQYFSIKPPQFIRHYLASQLKAILYNYAWNPYILKKLGKIFRNADLLLPNSTGEAKLLAHDFSIPPERIVPVVNGFDPTISKNAAAGLFKTEHGLNDYVLCAGRIEYRKNQLALIQALMDEPFPIVFIGQPFDPGYAALCKTLGKRRGKTLFINHLDQKKLFNAYRDARVHALVSWYETPGLSSLEAGSVGTNLVVTPGGCTKEYFGDGADYCDPGSLPSIKDAVRRAWSKPKSDGLQIRIATNYTWDKAGQQTMAAYHQVIASKS